MTGNINKIIAVSGVDGSGKTSVIDGVQSSLNRKGVANRYVWLRYNHYLTKFLLAFCKFTGFTKYEYFDDTRVVYHEFYRSKLVSWLFVLLTWIDTFFASLVRVYLPSLFFDTVIICDRWIFDIMVDLEVDTRLNFTEGTLLNRMFKWLLPGDAKCFVISRDMNRTKNTRKESFHDKNFPVRYELYQRHSHDAELNLINNNGTILQTVYMIKQQIALDTIKQEVS